MNRAERGKSPVPVQKILDAVRDGVKTSIPESAELVQRRDAYRKAIEVRSGLGSSLRVK